MGSGAGSRGAVARLYEGFQAKDPAAMEACYAPDATFCDEVFNLHGADEIGAMWRMLVERGRDLRIEVTDVHEDGRTGGAHWVATYTFAATGRPVVNEVDASFELRDGRIVRHVDRFGFWRWSRQALGAPGLLLGWTPIVRGRVRSMARRQLTSFRSVEG